jgi:hypothetical protein
VETGIPQPIVARALATSGASILIVALVLAVTVDSIAALGALLGVVDLGLAWAFASGRLGAGPAPEDRAAPPDPTADPSYNPYARED